MNRYLGHWSNQPRDIARLRRVECGRCARWGVDERYHECADLGGEA